MWFWLWLAWRHILRMDVEARRDLRRFVGPFFCQVAMVFVYPVMQCVYSIISSDQQTTFSMPWPVIKLMFKNWADYGAYRVEDQAPVWIVLTVDFFHALFLSSAMQASIGIGAFLVVAGVDILQSLFALVQVLEVLNCIRRLEYKMRRKASAPEPGRGVHSLLSRRSKTVFETAATILNTDEVVRDHPRLALPRHLRGSDDSASVWRATSASLCPGPLMKLGVRPIARSRGSAVASAVYSPSIQLTPLQSMQLQHVRYSLTLLHMLEFFALTEFAEVLIAIIYFVYLAAMANLPNRVYYVQLVGMSEDQEQITLIYVAKYAAYELASFLALLVAFDRVLNISSLKLMAFALQKHRRLVQAVLIVWVFITIQFTLEHFGNDYTFTFKWLHHPAT